jgi:hypothetical protein
MRLICYPVTADRPVIRPASRNRLWMDRTPEQYAYRCLPLVMANAHGWEMLCPRRYEIIWNGKPASEDIFIRTAGQPATDLVSHFGCGVITFHVNCIFRTDPDINLWISGPVNAPKDGVAPLTGVIESDWMPYTFTMNWVMTCPGKQVVFEEGEPFCFFFPVARGSIEGVTPEIRSLASDQETAAAYEQWNAGRTQFLKDLPQPGTPAQSQKWEKTYFRGLLPSGKPGIANHETKIQAQPFMDRTGPEK